jgi:hypothetical protein
MKLDLDCNQVLFLVIAFMLGYFFASMNRSKVYEGLKADKIPTDAHKSGPNAFFPDNPQELCENDGSIPYADHLECCAMAHGPDMVKTGTTDEQKHHSVIHSCLTQNEKTNICGTNTAPETMAAIRAGMVALNHMKGLDANDPNVTMQEFNAFKNRLCDASPTPPPAR